MVLQNYPVMKLSVSYDESALLTRYTQLDIRKRILSSRYYSQLICRRFDTIKVRLQTSNKAQFRGPLDCLAQTVRKEGVRGLYKGASPPLVGSFRSHWVMLYGLLISGDSMLQDGCLWTLCTYLNHVRFNSC